MEKEAIDTLAAILIVISCSYIGIIMLLMAASNWNAIINAILKFLSHGENVEDIRMSISLFKYDETRNKFLYDKTIKMSYRKFYKLWQSEKLDMEFYDISVRASYNIDDCKIQWLTIYFSLFDTLFRYIPLKRSIDYYKNDTKKNKKSSRLRRLENRKETMRQLEEYLKREE